VPNFAAQRPYSSKGSTGESTTYVRPQRVSAPGSEENHGLTAFGARSTRNCDSLPSHGSCFAGLPDDVAALKSALIAERSASLKVWRELRSRGLKPRRLALIAAQKAQDRQARAARSTGRRSERSALLIDQLALELRGLEASATEDNCDGAGQPPDDTVLAFTARRADRDTFPRPLPRERVVIDPPTGLRVLREPCASQARARNVTQTLETTPRRWKVIGDGADKFSSGTARRSATRRRSSVTRGGGGSTFGDDRVRNFGSTSL